MSHKASCHPTIWDAINDVKLFPTVYHRIYCRKFLQFSNQMSCYKSKCIRIIVCCFSHCVWGFCIVSLVCNVVLSVLSSFAIILLRKRELVALL